MRASGFTLIELLIAVTIMAIVSAVAIPMYRNYSERTYRSEAGADLLGCALALERFASVNFSYRNAADTDADGIGDDDAGPIAGQICDPLSGKSQPPRYAITVVADDATFAFTATPINNMAGNGILTLDDAGNRGWDRNGDNDTDDADELTWEY